MGCDIHIIAEVKVDGKWKPNTDKIFLNPYYKASAPNGRELSSYEKDELLAEPDGNRSYDWFSILADVRNGSGFGGVETGEGFKVIAEPRGVAEDASDEWKETVEGWEGDMHSHSWLTLADFDAFDWNQVTMKVGVIRLEEYEKLRGTNNTPDGWCGGVSGNNIVTISQDDADRLLAKEAPFVAEYKNREVYVRYHWSVLYSEWFEGKIKTTVEPLRKLKEKYEDVRLCFGFDN